MMKPFDKTPSTITKPLPAATQTTQYWRTEQ